MTALSPSKGRSFVWRGERRHRNRPWVPGGYQSTNRTIRVGESAYFGLCRIASHTNQTIKDAAEMLLKDLP